MKTFNVISTETLANGVRVFAETHLFTVTAVVSNGSTKALVILRPTVEGVTMNTFGTTRFFETGLRGHHAIEAAFGSIGLDGVVREVVKLAAAR